MSSSKKKGKSAVTLWIILKEYFLGPRKTYNTAEVVNSIGELMVVIWRNERSERLFQDYIKATEELDRYSEILTQFKEGTREHLLTELKILDLQEQVLKCASKI